MYDHVALQGAGWARFEGAAAVVNLLTTDPTESSAGSAAAWRALFGTANAAGESSYVSYADIEASDVGVFMTNEGTDPTATAGFPFSGESFQNMPTTIRAMKFFVPVGVNLYVRLWRGPM